MHPEIRYWSELQSNSTKSKERIFNVGKVEIKGTSSFTPCNLSWVNKPALRMNCGKRYCLTERSNSFALHWMGKLLPQNLWTYCKIDSRLIHLRNIKTELIRTSFSSAWKENSFGQYKWWEGMRKYHVWECRAIGILSSDMVLGSFSTFPPQFLFILFGATVRKSRSDCPFF